MNDEQLIWESYSKSVLLEQTVNTDFTLEFVDELENEFNTLISNIPKRVTPQNALQLSAAFKKVEDKHDEMITIFAKWESRKNIYGKHVREPWWNLILVLNRIYSTLKDYANNGGEELAKKLSNLKRSSMKTAKLTWEKMRFFIQNNPDMDINLSVPKHEMNVHGLHLTVYGLNDKNKERLERIKYYLKYYVERAQRVAPIMLKYKLPIVLHMEFDDAADQNAAGIYQYDKITLTAWISKAENEQEFTKTFAHEMAHHIHRSLSQDSKNFWNDAINGDMGELDVEEVIAMMKPDESASDFSKRMQKENPILELQAQSIFHNPFTSRYGIWNLHSLVRAYKEGKIKGKIPVPSTPITAYANKNSEEAFCEALGLYVAYGNRAVHEKIRSLLNAILPTSEGYRLGESVIES